jgi:hypothetical protein
MSSHQTLQEIHMSTYTSVSLRTRFERAIAGAIFGGATILLAGGTFAACFQNASLLA